MTSRAARRWVVALGLSLATACGASPPEEPSPARPPPAVVAEDRPPPPAEPVDRPALPGEVRSAPFDPEPIRVAVEDLPAPFATESARRTPRHVAPPADATLRVPAGFAVQRFAAGLPEARWLTTTPDGRVLLAQSREEIVTVLHDRDGDGVAEHRATFADGSNGVDIPFGMAFAGEHFYLGNQSQVRRYPWRDGQARLEGRGERVTRLPGGGYNQHWTRNVVVDADGEHLFVSVGSATNADPEPAPRASILRMRLDGSERRVFASGLRNPVGLAIEPATGALYTSVNERDHLGDGLVPDFFTRVEDGAFYGWPYAYLTADRLDPALTRGTASARPDLAARTRTPDVLFEAHSAPLGVAFQSGGAWPERYRGHAFVAFRGSWNRSRGTGYMIVHVPFEGGRPRGDYEPFVTGFLIDPSGPTTWGRPVGLCFLPDGSMLFTDEPGGVVYRVVYLGP